ncbi:hypothetical protein F6X40_27585 [Paraburkholderia sp. UCT31]|uniref:hypothetical protein n=1 Tax=Paraburkholderia sp. UCT31 TaxID=2615209 RepID=UPI001655DAF9|nr:hypothetical protein [Paraburkholderia sp. UCT31]MBC8740423.1 hypothetical protein [Paraburkholderia sp. UCT31]
MKQKKPVEGQQTLGQALKAIEALPRTMQPQCKADASVPDTNADLLMTVEVKLSYIVTIAQSMNGRRPMPLQGEWLKKVAAGLVENCIDANDGKLAVENVDEVTILELRDGSDNLLFRPVTPNAD